MLKLLDKIREQYTEFLREQKVPQNESLYYLKWLRYYLDFCNKYSHNQFGSGSLSHFVLKLKQKNQTENQTKQAKNAITLFYKMNQTSWGG